MSIKLRLNRLEERAASILQPERPWLTLTELLGEPGVFTEDSQTYRLHIGERTEPAQRFTREDFPELEKRYRLILVCFTKAWRRDGTGRVQLEGVE